MGVVRKTTVETRLAAVFFRSNFGERSTSDFRSTTKENPPCEDKSAGPCIDPEYFINFGVGCVRFAITMNPLRVRLYHSP